MVAIIAVVAIVVESAAIESAIGIALSSISPGNDCRWHGQ